MNDLTDFLLARIAEDEAVAAPFRNDFGDTKRWRADEIGGKVRQVGPTEFGLPDVISESDIHFTAVHIARHDPARVLAECDAKRRIVEAFLDAERAVATYNHAHPTDAYWQEWGNRHALALAVELLALPYADHPDFREEWKP